MSILHTLKAVKKAASFTTHEQRVQMLSEIPPDAVDIFLKTKSQTPSAGWLSTLTEIGALDASSFFITCANEDEVKQRLQEWIKVAHCAMDFVGEPKAKTSPNGIGPDSARKFTVFEASNETKDAFHRATQRLVLQADPLVQVGLKLPALDSHESLNSPLLGVLSRWAGTACMLNRPDTLKLVLDTWPEAMSCSIAADSATLAVARSNKSTDFQQTASYAHCRVTPFYCAMQVGSTACMDVIFDKRASLGLYLDMPFSAVARTEMNLGMTRAATFTSAMFRTDPVCSPESFAHAIGKIQPTLDAKEQRFLGTGMIAYGEKHPNHFAAVVGKGYFHENDTIQSFDGIRMRALSMSLLHAQSALPTMLKNVPWDFLQEMLENECSPITDATEKIRKDQRQPREDALFATHVSERKRGDKLLEPVTSLSAAGFNSVLMKFIDHGFHPDSKHPDVEATLNQVADANGHPTRNMLRSYVARTRAHKLIDEMDEAAPAKPIP